MSMQVEEAPSVWTKSTRKNIQKYSNQLLVESLRQPVRYASKGLLLALFKKGNAGQKKYLVEKVFQKLTSMKIQGKNARQIQEFIGDVIKLEDPVVSEDHTKHLELLMNKIVFVFDKWMNSPHADYFNFCQDILDNKGIYRPYLYELNGCTKCYGSVENQTLTSIKGLEEISEEVKYKGNKIMFTLKRTYEIKQFAGRIGIRQNQKSLNIIISVRDKQTGTIVKKGSLTPQTVLQFTTDYIQFQIQGVKLGRCINCGKNDEPAVHCMACRKSCQFSFKYKTLGGDNQKIMKQLGDAYRQVSTSAKKFHSFYSSIKNKRTIRNQLPDINEVEKTYKKIMLNFSLMKLPEDKVVPKQRFFSDVEICHSCMYYQISNFLSLLSDEKLLATIYKINSDFITKIYQLFMKIYKSNVLSTSTTSSVEKILGTIQFIVQSQNTQNPNLNSNYQSNIFNIFKHFLIKAKQNQSTNLNTLALSYKNNNNISDLEKLTLALIINMPKQDLTLLDKTTLTPQQYNNLTKFTTSQLNNTLSSLEFNLQSIVRMQLTNQVLLFLKYLPDELVPQSNNNNQVVSQSIIPYIKHKLPNIPKILPIVYSPYPLVPLNSFSNLPAISERLSADECSKLLDQLFKIKDFWNFNMYSTLESCNKIIQKQDTQKQFLIYIKGLSLIDDSYFLDKVSSFLIPKRSHFIIQVDLPNEDINEFVKKYQSEIEYPHLKQREVRTENLPGETMKDLYDWISSQMKEKMIFQMLCEKKSIHDLSVPIEMVHKKLYPKVQGKPAVEIMRVVYRIRGFFEGEDREDKLPPLGDDKLDECLQYARLLTQPIALNDGSKICGLDPFFKIFKNSRYRVELQQVRKTILKIFNIIYKNQSVRIKSIENNFVDILIRQTLASLVSKTEQGQKQKQILLEIVSKLIDQVNQFSSTSIRKQSLGGERKGSEFMDVQDDKILETANKNISLLLDKISESETAHKTADTISLIKLLPFSSKDTYEISERLFTYLSPLEVYETKNKVKLQKLLTFIEAIPRAYSNFKNICYDRKFLPAVLDSLISVLSINQVITQQLLIQYQQRLMLDLKILKFTIQSCQAFQKKFLEVKGLPLIHRLSTLSTQLSKITTLAEEIIKNLTDKSLVIQQLSAAAENIVEAYNQERRKKAQASRAATLQLQRKKRDLAAQNAFKNVAPVVVQNTQKYNNLKCVVCKASYESNNNVIGVYTFINKAEHLTMQRWWIDQSKKTPGGSSVSLFTVIHFQCHKSSQAYDNQMKVAEWDGAQKRNSDSKCNNWIPIRGESVLEQQYEKASRKYLDVMKGNAFWMVANDMKSLLMKLGNQDNLAKDSKGSIASNCKLLCAQLSFASSLVKKSFNEFKQSGQGIWYFNQRLIDNPDVLSTYLMFGIFIVNNTLFESSWKRLAFNHILKLSSKQTDPEKYARPFLIVLSIIKQIYKLIHAKIDAKKDSSNLYLSIEEYISNNLNVIQSFETLAEYYKNTLLKKVSTQEFEDEIFKQ